MEIFKHRLAFTLTVLCAVFSAPTAYAFLDPPYVTPAHPVAGSDIQVSIYGGVCDAIIGIPGYPQMFRDGNAIRILFASVHYSSAELCDLGVGTATKSVGSFPAGSYTLQVDRLYYNGVGEPVVETLGVVPFVVAGMVAAPVPAPTLNGVGLGVLGMFFIGIAGLFFRSRQMSLFVLIAICLPLGVRAQGTHLPNMSKS